eukprot:Phypoly_transcript_31329.p1 GENE.Phypoly_transcript_31329~~Phypoly_transcript_31329.p1  ORF type:complete len:111 (-),score=7.63 Phypoly_transcript_31329:44-376(-)
MFLPFTIVFKTLPICILLGPFVVPSQQPIVKPKIPSPWCRLVYRSLFHYVILSLPEIHQLHLFLGFPLSPLSDPPFGIFRPSCLSFFCGDIILIIIVIFFFTVDITIIII